MSQLEKNLAAIELEIPDQLRLRLKKISEIDQVHPYVFFGSFFQNWIKGGVEIRPWVRHTQ
jgi:hypothetical protein